MSQVEAAVKEHVRSMGIPASTGQHILDAATVVEEYLRNRAEMARITRETDEKEEAFKERKWEISNLYNQKIEALRDEERKEQKAIDLQITEMMAGTENLLNPLQDQITQVKRIITMLELAETIQPVEDIEDSHITTYHGEYLEWLGYAYKDELLKIRLLITENRKPKNKYSLLAYGRCAFDDTLLNKRRVYRYGTPNLKEYRGGYFTVRMELGSFASIRDAKAYAQRNANKPLKEFISDYEALKAEYLEVTAKFRLSDFERITAEKEGAK